MPSEEQAIKSFDFNASCLAKWIAKLPSEFTKTKIAHAESFLLQLDDYIDKCDYVLELHQAFLRQYHGSLIDLPQIVQITEEEESGVMKYNAEIAPSRRDFEDALRNAEAELEYTNRVLEKTLAAAASPLVDKQAHLTMSGALPDAHQSTNSSYLEGDDTIRLTGGTSFQEAVSDGHVLSTLQPATNPDDWKYLKSLAQRDGLNSTLLASIENRHSALGYRARTSTWKAQIVQGVRPMSMVDDETYIRPGDARYENLERLRQALSQIQQNLEEEEEL